MGLPDEKTAEDNASPPSTHTGNGVPLTDIQEEKPHPDDQLTAHSSGTETEEKSFQDGDGELNLKRSPTACDEPPEGSQVVATVSTVGPVHSVFSKNQKRFIVVMAAWAGFFSPVSANIYFPALNSLARDLRVTSTLINLTLTSYMVRASYTKPWSTSRSHRCLDLPRSRTVCHWQPRRQRWPPPCLCSMFRRLHCGEHWTCPTEQLCSSFRASVHTELRK